MAGMTADGRVTFWSSYDDVEMIALPMVSVRVVCHGPIDTFQFVPLRLLLVHMAIFHAEPEPATRRASNQQQVANEDSELNYEQTE